TTLMSDAQVYIENSPDTQIYNNTVYSLAPYPNTFEYRFSDTTNVLIENNLTNLAITARDSATGTVADNITNAQSAWFVSTTDSVPDLHLSSAVSQVVGQGGAIAGLTDDFDKQTRGASID